MSRYIISSSTEFINVLCQRGFPFITVTTETKQPRKLHRPRITPFPSTARFPSIPLRSNFQQSGASTNFESTSITKCIAFLHMRDDMTTCPESDIDNIVSNKRMTPGKLRLLASSPIKRLLYGRDHETPAVQVYCEFD